MTSQQSDGSTTLDTALLDTALLWLAWICLAATFALASYVIFHEYRFSLNSDGAVADILAKLANEEGRLVPHNWTYANGDLWILGPRLFLVILYPWLGLSYFLHAAATWLSYVYLLLMVYASCRILAPDRPRAAVIATTLAAGGFSTLSFEFVIGQGAYSLYAALALALFVFASRSEPLDIRRRFRALTLLLAGVAAALVCVTNAKRGGATVIAPLITGWFAASILFSRMPWRERVRNVHPLTIVVIIVGAIVGTLVYEYCLLPGVVDSSGAATFALASIQRTKHNLMTLAPSWLTYFQATGGWEWLSPLQRILQCFIWLVSIALLLIPMRVVSAPKRHLRALVTFSWITLACYGVAFAALVASKHLFDGPASLRYISFAIYASASVLAIVVDGTLRHHPRTGAVLAGLLCLIPVATIASWHAEWTPGGVTYSQRMALIKSLKGHHVESVLATYWNSEVLTVLSSGEVEGLPVDLSKNVGLRRHAQNSPLIARPAGPANRYAVALTAKEAPPSRWKTITAQLGTPTQLYESVPFTVAVYNRDIVRSLYGKHPTINVPVPVAQLMIRLSQLTFPACKATHPCEVSVQATNIGSHVLTSVGTEPLRLGIHGTDAEGRVLKWDAGRADFPAPIEPGSSERIVISLPPMSNPKVTAYRICLLQENVAWRCNRTQPPKLGGVGTDD